MRSSEVIKKAIKSDMPDLELVRKKCIEELQQETERHAETNQKKTGRNMRKVVYAGVGLCAVVLLCAINLSAHSDAESFIARLQTWLHIDNERVTVGEMKKNSIHIPEDCEEVEYGGEKYLTKSYSSPEELEEDIGKHLEIWRDVEEYKQNDIVLNIVEEEYARVSFIYDVSKIKGEESTDDGDKIQSVECYVTFPLSEDFSMNNIKLKDQFLKDAVLDEKGQLITYSQSGDYSLLETYHSAHLDTNISVIGQESVTNINSRQDDIMGYYSLYFVHKGLSYQMNSNSNLEIVKAVVEELE